MTAYEVEYRVEGHIGYLTLNRPEKMNAMTRRDVRRDRRRRWPGGA